MVGEAVVVRVLLGPGVGLQAPATAALQRCQARALLSAMLLVEDGGRRGGSVRLLFRAGLGPAFPFEFFRSGSAPGPPPLPAPPPPPPPLLSAPSCSSFPSGCGGPTAGPSLSCPAAAFISPRSAAAAAASPPASSRCCCSAFFSSEGGGGGLPRLLAAAGATWE